MKHFCDLLACIIFVVALFTFTFVIFKAGAAAVARDKREIRTASEMEEETPRTNAAAIPDKPNFQLVAEEKYVPCDALKETAEAYETCSEKEELGLQEDDTREEAVTVDETELEMLACTIYIEAGGDSCSDETRLMVGNVVLNRVADDRFPDTMEEVLLQPRQYNTFSWTGIKWPERASNESEADAVARAYDCARRLLEGERVLDDDVIFQSEHIQGTEIVVYQDGIYFCR